MTRGLEIQEYEVCCFEGVARGPFISLDMVQIIVVQRVRRHDRADDDTDLNMPELVIKALVINYRVSMPINGHVALCPNNAVSRYPRHRWQLVQRESAPLATYTLPQYSKSWLSALNKNLSKPVSLKAPPSYCGRSCSPLVT